MSWLINVSKNDDSLDGLRVFLGLPKRRHIIVITDLAGTLETLGF